MNAKDLRGGTNPSQRPRSPRVPVEFALEVEGNTADGKTFHVKAQAIKISRAGATIILAEQVAEGSVVTLTLLLGESSRRRLMGFGRTKSTAVGGSVSNYWTQMVGLQNKLNTLNTLNTNERQPHNSFHRM